MVQKKIIGVIPARFGSARFPGKMLADILGKSLIQRTYENTLQCSSLEEIVIATDDERIYHHATHFGAKAIMTPVDCPTGTDRVAKVIESYFPHAEIVVNIQGDEPCLDPLVIDRLVARLLSEPHAKMTTPVVKISSYEVACSPSVVKCVFTKEGKALYFSRSPIPFPQKGVLESAYFRHMGVYCFRKEFLLEYALLPKTHLQQIEDLEQLKILEHGHVIYVTEVEKDHGVDVNTPEDIKKVEEKLCKESTSLLLEALSPL